MLSTLVKGNFVRTCAFSVILLTSSVGAMANKGKGGDSSQGASNGQPFQQVQEAIDAANAAVEAAINANTSAIEANSSSIGANSAASAANASAIESAEAAINANAAAAAANESAIGANTAASAANASAIESAEAAIDANTAATTSNSAAITAEEAARMAADAAAAAEAASQLASEIADRIAAEESLQDSIDTNADAIAANAAAVAAEEAARQAADAAQDALFAAELVLEATARAAADDELQAAIEAEEAARNEGLNLLGIRVDELEALHPMDLIYVETNEFDLGSLKDDLIKTNYTQDQWIYISSVYSPSGGEQGICTNDLVMYNALSKFVMDGDETFYAYDVAGSVKDSGGWTEGLYDFRLDVARTRLSVWVTFTEPSVTPTEPPPEGKWVKDRPVIVRHMDIVLTDYTGRPAYYASKEIMINRRTALGNTVEFRTGDTRLDTCGF